MLNHRLEWLFPKRILAGKGQDLGTFLPLNLSPLAVPEVRSVCSYFPVGRGGDKGRKLKLRLWEGCCHVGDHDNGHFQMGLGIFPLQSSGAQLCFSVAVGSSALPSQTAAIPGCGSHPSATGMVFLLQFPYLTSPGFQEFASLARNSLTCPWGTVKQPGS